MKYLFDKNISKELWKISLISVEEIVKVTFVLEVNESNLMIFVIIQRYCQLNHYITL